MHIGSRGGDLAVEDLRREVARRPEQPAGVGQFGIVGDAGEAEVDQNRRTTLHQHVGRLDVAVEYADRVDAREALGQAAGEPQQVAALDRAFLRHVVVKGQSRDVTRGDVRDLRPRIRHDDLGHPLAGDPAQRADLAREPMPGLVVANDVGSQHLQRNAGAGLVVPSQMDDAHAALADLGEQRVVANDLPFTGVRGRSGVA